MLRHQDLEMAWPRARQLGSRCVGGTSRAEPSLVRTQSLPRAASAGKSAPARSFQPDSVASHLEDHPRDRRAGLVRFWCFQANLGQRRIPPAQIEAKPPLILHRDASHGGPTPNPA